MRGQWDGGRAAAPPAPPLYDICKDGGARRLLLLALVNATPVAVSSTLFLFFVTHRLQAWGWEGPLLVLFFASGAVAAPLWSRAARTYGAKATLLTAMGTSVLIFSFTATLGRGITGGLRWCVFCQGPRLARI